METSNLEAQLVCVHLGHSRRTAGKITFHLAAITGSLAMGLGLAGAVAAQTLDDYLQRQVFDFEQCANACQIDLDKRLFACAPYREDKSREAPDDCFESNYDLHNRCMNTCPVDPRKQP
jgi:hypothetical protein